MAGTNPKDLELSATLEIVQPACANPLIPTLATARPSVVCNKVRVRRNVVFMFVSPSRLPVITVVRLWRNNRAETPHQGAEDVRL